MIDLNRVMTWLLVMSFGAMLVGVTHALTVREMQEQVVAAYDLSRRSIQVAGQCVDMDLELHNTFRDLMTP